MIVRILYISRMNKLKLKTYLLEVTERCFYIKKDRCGDTGNWTLYEGQCYSCTGDELSWYSARSSCYQIGAILVVISNSGIQAFLEGTKILLVFFVVTKRLKP